MNKTGIEWTHFTSNPLRYRDAAGKTVWACVKHSPGCAFCYAEALAVRFDRGGKFIQSNMDGLTPYLDEQVMCAILTSKKISGKRVFVNDMTDMFGPWVPVELLDQQFAAFQARPDVEFQLLTKRPDVAREYLLHARERVFEELMVGKVGNLRAQAGIVGHGTDWPLPNVWLGTSVESQYQIKRVMELVQCPAAVHYLSLEPLLGPIQLLLHCPKCGYTKRDAGIHCDHHLCKGGSIPAIDWVIAGGESGPGARECRIHWVRDLRDQCRAAHVPFFFKQGGSNFTVCHGENDLEKFRRLPTRDPKGGDMNELPADLRVRQFPQRKAVA